MEAEVKDMNECIRVNWGTGRRSVKDKENHSCFHATGHGNFGSGANMPLRLALVDTINRM